MSARDGGPAFPQHDFEYYPGGGGAGRHTITGGMSLRDWFAGQALQGFLAEAAHPQSAGVTREYYRSTADECYRLADAMLAAREPSDG